MEREALAILFLFSSYLSNLLFFILILEMVEHELHVFQIRPNSHQSFPSPSPLSDISDMRIASLFRRGPTGTASSSDAPQESDNLLIPMNNSQSIDNPPETRLSASSTHQRSRNFSPPQTTIREITSYFRHTIADEISYENP